MEVRNSDIIILRSNGLEGGDSSGGPNLSKGSMSSRSKKAIAEEGLEGDLEVILKGRGLGKGT